MKRPRLRASSRTPDGRKYRLSIMCLLIILVAFGCAGVNPIFAKLLPELITGVLGVLFVYNGGNVANKWAIGKAGGLTVGAGPTPKQGEQNGPNDSGS